MPRSSCYVLAALALSVMSCSRTTVSPPQDEVPEASGIRDVPQDGIPPRPSDITSPNDVGRPSMRPPQGPGRRPDPRPDERPPDPPLVCGGRACDRTLPGLPDWIMDLLEYCCSPERLCGMRLSTQPDLCVPFDQPGELDPRCPPVSGVQVGGVWLPDVFAGCCTPTGQCGQHAGIGFGCVERSTFGVAGGLDLEPMRCEVEGDGGVDPNGDTDGGE